MVMVVVVASVGLVGVGVGVTVVDISVFCGQSVSQGGLAGGGGQPVEREVYASVEEARGIVPWPTPRYPGSAASDRHASPVWEVTHWQLDLVLLLKDLGASAGDETVESFVHRCRIAVVE